MKIFYPLVGGPKDGKRLNRLRLEGGSFIFPVTDHTYLSQADDGTYSWFSHRYDLDYETQTLMYVGMMYYAFNLDTGLRIAERVEKS